MPEEKDILAPPRYVVCTNCKKIYNENIIAECSLCPPPKEQRSSACSFCLMSRSVKRDPISHRRKCKNCLKVDYVKKKTTMDEETKTEETATEETATEAEVEKSAEELTGEKL